MQNDINILVFVHSLLFKGSDVGLGRLRKSHRSLYKDEVRINQFPLPNMYSLQLNEAKKLVKMGYITKMNWFGCVLAKSASWKKEKLVYARAN